MTGEMMTSRALVEQTPDADLLRDMIGFAAERLMELEVVTATGAAYGEKDPGRKAQCNGYRQRDWETRAGTVERRIPRLRTGPISPAFSSRAGWPRMSPRTPPVRESGRTVTAVSQGAYVQGISTRSVDDLIKAMGMASISKSQVSRLCEDKPLSAIGPRAMANAEPDILACMIFLKEHRAKRHGNVRRSLYDR